MDENKIYWIIKDATSTFDRHQAAKEILKAVNAEKRKALTNQQRGLNSAKTRKVNRVLEEQLNEIANDFDISAPVLTKAEIEEIKKAKEQGKSKKLGLASRIFQRG